MTWSALDNGGARAGNGARAGRAREPAAGPDGAAVIPLLRPISEGTYRQAGSAPPRSPWKWLLRRIGGRAPEADAASERAIAGSPGATFRLIRVRPDRWVVMRQETSIEHAFDDPASAEAFARREAGDSLATLEIRIGEFYVATRLDPGRPPLFGDPRRPRPAACEPGKGPFLGALAVLVVMASLLQMGSAGAGEPCPHRRPPGAASCFTGIASWYGAERQGRRTASGESFDRNDLTAAHPFLPMQAKVHVVDLATGRSVTVRINDRGPGLGRAIDLSQAAARRIGIEAKGLGRVRIERVFERSE